MRPIPLSQYALIGNKYSVALVSRDGSIDWCCMPFLHSPSIFSALINPEDGGYFSIRPMSQFTSSQHYIRATNIIETAFRSTSGTVIVTDFMPIYSENEEILNPEIIRVIRCCDGEMELEIDYYPKFNYGKGWNKITEVSGGILTRNYDETGILASPIIFSISEGHARARISVNNGEEIALVFCYGIFSPSRRLDRAVEKLVRAVQYWRAWISPYTESGISFHRSFHESIIRSILVLKLMTNPLTGLLAEAPAVYLSGSKKPFQYRDGRVCWMHGIEPSCALFARLGYHYEAEVLMKTAEKLCRQFTNTDFFQTVLLPDGNQKIKEIKIKDSNNKEFPLRSPDELLKGYGYYAVGFLIFSLYEYLKFKKRVPDQVLWENITRLIDRVMGQWKEPDGDFWKETSEKKQFVISKILCWVALDRGIRLARENNLSAPVQTWENVRDAVHKDICEHGFNSKKKSFVQTYGSEVIDATALLIPRFEFLSIEDEKLCQTVETIRNNLVEKGYLVRRWSNAQETSAHSICSLWLIDCLARLGQYEKSKEILFQFLAKTEPLGLVPEKIDIEKEEFSGYIPHVYAQAELLNSILSVAEAEKKEGRVMKT